MGRLRPEEVGWDVEVKTKAGSSFVMELKIVTPALEVDDREAGGAEATDTTSDSVKTSEEATKEEVLANRAAVHSSVAEDEGENENVVGQSLVNEAQTAGEQPPKVRHTVL